MVIYTREDIHSMLLSNTSILQNIINILFQVLMISMDAWAMKLWLIFIFLLSSSFFSLSSCLFSCLLSSFLLNLSDKYFLPGQEYSLTLKSCF